MDPSWDILPFGKSPPKTLSRKPHSSRHSPSQGSHVQISGLQEDLGLLASGEGRSARLSDLQKHGVETETSNMDIAPPKGLLFSKAPLSLTKPVSNSLDLWFWDVWG